MAASSTRTLWKGAISFGLVHIPIALHSATEDSRPKFKMIDKETGSAVGYKKIDKSTGAELQQSDIVKGMEVDKGQYVTLTKEEIQQALPKTTGTISIEAFVKREEIPLAFFNKPYYISPAARGGKPYALLREVLRQTGRVGLGKVVISTKQHLAIIAPQGNLLTLELLRWAEEIRDVAGLPIPGDAKAEGLSDKELKMGESLVLDLDEPWSPEKYRDEFKEKLEALTEAKRKAGEVTTLAGVVADEIVPQAGADVVDLTELLRRSLRGKTGESAAAANDEPAAAPRKRSKAANDDEHEARKAAAKKSSAKSSTSVKPARRKSA
jgi:DNA end-binding protein Ku